MEDINDEIEETKSDIESPNADNQTPDTAKISDIDRALVEAQEEARTNLAGWQRAQADFANYKTREEAKQKDLLDFAKEVTVVKMLPTLDSMEQGLKHIPNETDPDFSVKFNQWKTGVEGVLQKLSKVLEEMGVQKIEAIGKEFDPNFHEAIREVPGETDGTIVDEVQIGYQINGKVIRPSQVIISKKST